MKTKRPSMKRYITILLDENELEKRRIVKEVHRLSDRKIYMAMIDALQPVNTIEQAQPMVHAPDNVMTDETVIIEEE